MPVTDPGSIYCPKLIFFRNLAVNSFLNHCSLCTHTVLFGREFQDCKPATETIYFQVTIVCVSECILQVVVVSLHLLPLCFQVRDFMGLNGAWCIKNNRHQEWYLNPHLQRRLRPEPSGLIFMTFEFRCPFAFFNPSQMPVFESHPSPNRRWVKSFSLLHCSVCLNQQGPIPARPVPYRKVLRVFDLSNVKYPIGELH